MTEDQQHADASPSGYDQWEACPGSIAMQSGEPDGSNQYSIEGTVAHGVGEYWLNNGHPPADADPDMIEHVRKYVDAVKQRVSDFEIAGANEVMLFVEQRLPISNITGEKNAFGTADVVIIAVFADYSILEVDDLKYGMGVKVDVVDNGQLKIYALAALHKYATLHNFQEVIMRIHQPRVYDNPSEWSIDVPTLVEFGESVGKAAKLALQLKEDGILAAVEYLNPGEDQCRFCRAKYKCPALAQQVHETIFGEFQNIDDDEAVPLPVEDRLVGQEDSTARLLSLFMKRVPLIEEWCKAIRAQTEKMLFDGESVPGYKLVEGKMGNRQFTDKDAAEKLLIANGAGPDLIFKPKELLSPTQLEKKLGKKPIWVKLEKLITQKPGNPSVAPEDDPRTPYTPVKQADFDSYDGSDLV